MKEPPESEDSLATVPASAPSGGKDIKTFPMDVHMGVFDESGGGAPARGWGGRPPPDGAEADGERVADDSRMAAATTVDGFLDGRLKLLQPRTGYRASTDSPLLAAAVPAGAGEAVLELGLGTGVAALCLVWRTGADVTGVELQPDYAALARRNASRSRLRLKVVDGDVAELPREVRDRSYDHVMANPPYLGPGTASPDAGRETANRAALPVSRWVEEGLRRLKPKGTLTLISRSGGLPEILAAMKDRGTVAVLPIQSRADRPSSRVIAQCRKGGRGSFVLLAPFIMHAGEKHRDGEGFSRAAGTVLRDGAPLPPFGRTGCEPA